MTTENNKELEHDNIRLTSAEMTALWSGYLNDSMSICVLSYFLNNCDDEEVKPVIEYALGIFKEHIDKLTTLFEKDNFPIPKGFGEGDVNVEAPRLFSDTFYLYYLKGIATIGLSGYSTSLNLVARKDIAAYFNECVAFSVELMNKVREILLNKGLYIRPPYISTPKQVSFVHDKSFLSGFFGEKRPLSGIEITDLFLNLQNNALGKALLMGFSQVATSQKISKYMYRGVEIAKKHIAVFNKPLINSNLPTPTTWDSEVSSSTTSPFSEKLMMFHVNALNITGIGNYGLATAASQRSDLMASYARLQMEISQYAKDGADIMINNAWLEQPPLADDRKGLAGLKE